MWISRIRVTGGFLADLDLDFDPGLNVIIGPRGAGKTTLLELIRHALGLDYAQLGKDARQPSLIASLLGAGEVILDLQDDEAPVQLIVDGSGRGRLKRYETTALMIGQNELESIASDPESRLKLLDMRADVEELQLPAPEIALLTARMYEARAQISELVDRLRGRETLLADREQLVRRETALMGQASTELTITRTRLAGVEQELQGLQQDADATGELQALITTTVLDLTKARSRFDNREFRPLANRLPSDLLADINQARVFLGDAHSLMRDAAAGLDRQLTIIAGNEFVLRAEATPLRARLDESEKGLGEVTAMLRNLDLQLARLTVEQDRLRDYQAQFSNMSMERATLLDHMELAQERRYAARTRIAETVSTRLANKVMIRIEHLTESTGYKSLLSQLLQGSGIQFRGPADAIAKTTLPRQLVEMIEADEPSTLALLTGLPDQRLSRALAHLDNPEALSKIASASIEDSVDFLLQVGSEVKSVDELSTGQKCAVTLPILLTEHSRTLLLDQPEDHLDNAYLVETVVRSIRSRVAAGAQTIVATHNANIPVLGAADLVVSLNSDGQRGFITHAGHVDALEIVTDITDLMEGGLEAFHARAEFYKRFGARGGSNAS